MPTRVIALASYIGAVFCLFFGLSVPFEDFSLISDDGQPTLYKGHFRWPVTLTCCRAFDSGAVTICFCKSVPTWNRTHISRMRGGRSRYYATAAVSLIVYSLWYSGTSAKSTRMYMAFRQGKIYDTPAVLRDPGYCGLIVCTAVKWLIRRKTQINQSINQSINYVHQSGGTDQKSIFSHPDL